MAVAEYSWKLGILKALCNQERTGRPGTLDQAAGKAQPLEQWNHVVGDIALQLSGAGWVLAFGRDRDPLGQFGLEGATVKVPLDSRDGRSAGH